MIKERIKFQSQDYSASEKESFIDALVKKGCTPSTAYVRLFRDGFVPWQMNGIVRTVQSFAATANIEIPEDLSQFYGSMTTYTELYRYMANRGMGENTVRTRFKAWNFKPWELEGVSQILPQLCQNLDLQE